MGAGPRRDVVALLVGLTLLGLAGCRGGGEHATRRDAVKLAIARAVAPLEADIDGAQSAQEFGPLSEDLRSRLRDVEPPEGVEAITLTDNTWSAFSEQPDEHRHVGNAVVVIPVDPQENEPYCLGVTVDNLDGVVFTPGEHARVDDGCSALKPPGETQ